MDQTKVAQMVEGLNGLTARDALCLLAGMLTVLDEAPSDEERQQLLDGCRSAKARSGRFDVRRTAYDPRLTTQPSAAFGAPGRSVYFAK
jgi:hypothetical protein